GRRAARPPGRAGPALRRDPERRPDPPRARASPGRRALALRRATPPAEGPRRAHRGLAPPRARRPAAPDRRQRPARGRSPGARRGARAGRPRPRRARVRRRGDDLGLGPPLPVDPLGPLGVDELTEPELEGEEGEDPPPVLDPAVVLVEERPRRGLVDHAAPPGP